MTTKNEKVCVQTVNVFGLTMPRGCEANLHFGEGTLNLHDPTEIDEACQDDPSACLHHLYAVPPSTPEPTREQWECPYCGIAKAQAQFPETFDGCADCYRERFDPPDVTVAPLSDAEGLTDRDRRIIRQQAWELHDEYAANPDTSAADQAMRQIRQTAERMMAERDGGGDEDERECFVDACANCGDGARHDLDDETVTRNAYGDALCPSCGADRGVYSAAVCCRKDAEPTRDRRCGSQGLDADGHCIRCGLKPDEDVINDQPECPPGFLAPQSPAGEQVGASDAVVALDQILRDCDLQVRIGLRAQGHMPAVEKMLRDGKTWDDIGAAIGWHGPSVREWWSREVLADLAELSRLRLASSAMHDDITALLRALDLGVHARDKSPHEVMVEEIIPAVSRLRSLASEEGLRDLAMKIPVTYDAARERNFRVLTEHFEEKK